MLKYLKKQVRLSLARRGYHLTGPDALGRSWAVDCRRYLSPHPVSVIFDVGANVGQTVAELRKYYPEAVIHCFEPSQQPFDALVESLRGDPSARLNRLALGATEGTATLYTHSHHQADSLLPSTAEVHKFIHGEKVDSSGREVVPVRTLDNYCREKQVENIDVLKIDVQGFELKVLQGAEGLLAGGQVKAVVVEFQFAPHYEDQSWYFEVCQFLHRHQFRLAGLYEAVWDDAGFLSWGNGLFVRPPETRPS